MYGRRALRVSLINILKIGCCFQLYLSIAVKRRISNFTDDRRPTTDDRRPTTDDRRPTTDDRRLLSLRFPFSGQVIDDRPLIRLKVFLGHLLHFFAGNGTIDFNFFIDQFGIAVQ